MSNRKDALMVKTCSGCGRLIPKVRLEALPHTERCVRCSVERPLGTRDVWIDGADDADLRHEVQNSAGDRS